MIAGGHSFLWHGTPIFNCIFCIQSNLELKFLHVGVFVKIPFQHINYPYMLGICRPNFMKFKDWLHIFSTWCKHMALSHRNVKNTIFMFPCKPYFDTCLVWITMLVRLLVDVDMFSVFPKRKKQYSLILSATILIQWSAYTIILPKWYNMVTSVLTTSTFWR